MIAPNDQIASAPNQDFARLVEMQQRHSQVTLQIETLETKMSREALNAAASNATDYVVLQEELATLDGRIKEIFARHPEWREGEKKSVKTPFGSVEQRTVTELEVPNEAATVALIEQRAKSDPNFDASLYLHVKKSPNLEALEAMKDDELALLGITRVKSEKITVKAAKVSAKAVAKAAAKAKGTQP